MLVRRRVAMSTNKDFCFMMMVTRNDVVRRVTNPGLTFLANAAETHPDLRIPEKNHDEE